MKVLYDGPAMEERKSKWGDHSNRSIAAGDVANQGRHYEARAAGGHRARSARVADHRRFKLAPVVALALCGYKYCTIKHGPCAVVRIAPTRRSCSRQFEHEVSGMVAVVAMLPAHPRPSHSPRPPLRQVAVAACAASGFGPRPESCVLAAAQQPRDWPLASADGRKGIRRRRGDA